MWAYHNPVKIKFGNGSFNSLSELIAGRRYALITYPDAPFPELQSTLTASAGKPIIVIDDIAPNPDYRLLSEQSDWFKEIKNDLEVIVAPRNRLSSDRGCRPVSCN